MWKDLILLRQQFLFVPSDVFLLSLCYRPCLSKEVSKPLLIQVLKNILFMTFGKVELKRLKIGKENCISLLLMSPASDSLLPFPRDMKPWNYDSIYVFFFKPKKWQEAFSARCCSQACKKKTPTKQKTVTLRSAGNGCWIFHRGLFLTDIGNFKLCIYLKYLVTIQKSPCTLILCIACF